MNFGKLNDELVNNGGDNGADNAPTNSVNPPNSNDSQNNDNAANDELEKGKQDNLPGSDNNNPSATEEGSNADGNNSDNVTNTTPSQVSNIPDDIKKKLEENGFSSIEELLEKAKAAQTPPAEETEEEKKKKEETSKVDFYNFAVEKGLSVDDVNLAENLSNKDLVELVFDSFKEEYFNDNPDDDEEDARFAFNSRHNIVDGEELKPSSKKLLEIQKNAILSEKLADYNKVKADYEDLKVLKSKEPEFNNLIQKTLKEFTNVDLELGNSAKTKFIKNIPEKEILDEISKNFGPNFMLNIFGDYCNGQESTVVESLKNAAKLVRQNIIFEEAMNAHGEAMKSIGISEGALGSKHPFNKNEVLQGNVNDGENLESLKNAYQG